MALDIALLPCAGKDEAGFHSMLTHTTPTLDETLQRHILLRRLVTAQHTAAPAAHSASSTALAHSISSTAFTHSISST